MSDTPNTSLSRIGEILVAMGKVTEAQLNEALVEQGRSDATVRKPLGQILLEKDYVEPNDIIEAIKQQVKLRGGEVGNSYPSPN